MRKATQLIPVNFLLITLSACSTSRTALDPVVSPPEAASSSATKEPSREEAILKNSEIEITYLLHQDSHRLIVRSEDSRALGQSFTENELMKEAKVAPTPYLQFFERISQFVREVQTSESSRSPARNSNCRQPFRISLKIGNKQQNVDGCRTTDDGPEISRLTRDAEFLLYSKKQ